jgi:hypothetical protein
MQGDTAEDTYIKSVGNTSTMNMKPPFLGKEQFIA